MRLRFLFILVFSIFLSSCKARYIKNGINAPRLMAFHADILAPIDEENTNTDENEESKEINKIICKNFQSTEIIKCDYLCQSNNCALELNSLAKIKKIKQPSACMCEFPINKFRYLYNLYPYSYGELLSVKFFTNNNELSIQAETKTLKYKSFSFNVTKLPKLTKGKVYNIVYQIKNINSSISTYTIENLTAH